MKNNNLSTIYIYMCAYFVVKQARVEAILWKCFRDLTLKLGRPRFQLPVDNVNTVRS